MDGFDYVHRERVRFRDVDALGHVNNAVFLTYLEEARIGFLQPIGAEASGMILARVEIDFRAPLRMGDELEIGVRPVGVGTKSFELAYQVRARETVAAEAKTVLVSFDYETGRPVEVPQAWREVLAA
ncbi:MAG TPA: thioesterase family protein [Gaiellaceae bacterium]|nr:thioesterase family protein [Gaiellaceae bacterium]